MAIGKVTNWRGKVLFSPSLKKHWKWALLSAALLAISVGCARLIGYHFGSENRIPIIVAVVIGAISAAVSGVLAGRILRSGFRTWRILPGLVLFAAFVYLVFLSVTRVSLGVMAAESWEESFLFPAAVFLLVMNSYLVGFLLLPATAAGSSLLRVAAIILIYVPIPVGICRGVDPPGSVPIDPGWGENLAGHCEGFPGLRKGTSWKEERPRFEDLELSDGRHRLILLHPTLSQGAARLDETVPAPAGTAVLEQGYLSITGHGSLFPRDFSMTEEDEADSIDPFLDTLSAPARNRVEQMRSEIDFQYGILLDASEELNLHIEHACLVSNDPAARLDQQTRIEPLGDVGNETRRFFLLSLPRLFLQGPAELRLRVWWGTPREFPLAKQVGQAVVTHQNVFTLLGVYRSAHIPPMDSKHEVIVSPLEGRGTTAVLHAEFLQPGETFSTRVRTAGGTIIEGRLLKRRGHLLIYRFECWPKDIVEFQVAALPHYSHVRFALEEIRGFPDKNRGCEDLLEMRVPVIRPGYVGNLDSFVRRVGGNRIWPWSSSGAPRLPAGWRRGISVRNILDECYPNQWRMEFADHRGSRRIIIGHRAPTGVAWKVGCAFGGASSSEIDPYIVELLRSL